MNTIPIVDVDDVRARVGAQSFKRGEQYFRGGAIFAPRRRGTTPSRLMAEFFRRYLPDFIAESVRNTIEINLDEPEPEAGRLALIPDEPEAHKDAPAMGGHGGHGGEF